MRLLGLRLRARGDPCGSIVGLAGVGRSALVCLGGGGLRAVFLCRGTWCLRRRRKMRSTASVSYPVSRCLVLSHHLLSYVDVLSTRILKSWRRAALRAGLCCAVLWIGRRGRGLRARILGPARRVGRAVAGDVRSGGRACRGGLRSGFQLCKLLPTLIACHFGDILGDVHVRETHESTDQNRPSYSLCSAFVLCCSLHRANSQCALFFHRV